MSTPARVDPDFDPAALPSGLRRLWRDGVWRERDLQICLSTRREAISEATAALRTERAELPLPRQVADQSGDGGGVGFLFGLFLFGTALLSQGRQKN